jgi:sugar phosphate isomerase/epimerase
VKALKAAGYDGTITLEIFSNDPEYLQIGKRKFEDIWRSC